MIRYSCIYAITSRSILSVLHATYQQNSNFSPLSLPSPRPPPPSLSLSLSLSHNRTIAELMQTFVTFMSKYLMNVFVQSWYINSFTALPHIMFISTEFMFLLQLDVRKEGEEIINIICRSFGIHSSGEFDLYIKKQKVYSLFTSQ